MKTSVARLRLALVSLITLLLLAGVPSAALAGQWGAPIAGPAGQDVSVVLDADGVATSIWQEESAVGACRDSSRGVGCSLRASRLGAHGWDAPATLSADLVFRTEPTLVVSPDGSVTAGWVQTDGAEEGKSVWVSRFSGGAWSTAVPLVIGANAIYYAPRLAVNGSGTVLAVWIDEVTGATGWSQFAGGSWSAAAVVPVGGRTSDYVHDVEASPDGSFTAFLRQADGVATARLAGSDWADEGLISPGRGPQYEFAGVVVDGQGTITAAWRSDGYTIESARRVNGEWTPSVPVSSPSENARSPRLVADGSGVVTAVWKAVADEAIQYARAIDGEWSRPDGVAAPHERSEIRALVLDGHGDPLLLVDGYDPSIGAWPSFSTGFSHGTWSSPQALVPDLAWSVGGENAGFAVNARGSGVAIGAPTTDRDRIQSIRFGSVPLAPTGVRGVAGVREVAAQWTAPALSDAPPVRSYTATASPGGRSCSTTGGLRCAITGLTAGMTYRVTVVAANEFGTGPASAPSDGISVPAGPAAVIAAKRIVTRAADGSVSVRVPVTVPGPGEVTLNGTTASGGGSTRSSASRPVWRCTVAAVFAKAGTRTLTCRLRARARAQLRRGALRFAFETIYVPTGGVPVRSVARVNIARHR